MLWRVGLALIHHARRVPSLAAKMIYSPARRFDGPNSGHAAASEDRERLIRVGADLERSIDLTIMEKIGFDRHNGILCFTKVNPSTVPEKIELQVHAADCPLFEAMVNSDGASIEFCTAESNGFDSLLLTLRNNEGDFRWGSGVMVRFSQPQRLRDLLAHQLRLVDLGGMASAIVHEIKQPLYTIAIAAENLRLMLEKRQDDIADPQMSDRVSRIGEQADRARKIIERTERYGRADASSSQEIDVGEVIGLVLEMLAPGLEERRITADVRIAADNCKVIMPSIALEQVLVNAVRNAADSIKARETSGWTGKGHILFEVAAIERTLRCTISDNGIGLPPGMAETAFNAFFSTKPDHQGSGLGLFVSRQIMAEANGSIRLLPRSDGAAVELELPLSHSLP